MLLFTMALSAQWLEPPTRGVPLTRDGKPNLSAPAPRAANGKPDLSGIWELEHAPCPAEGCGDYAGGPEFMNLGVKLAGSRISREYGNLSMRLARRRGAAIMPAVQSS